MKSKFFNWAPLILVAAAIVIMALPVSHGMRFLINNGTDFSPTTYYSYFSFFAYASGSAPYLPTAVLTSVLFIILVIVRLCRRPLRGVLVTASSGICFALSVFCLLPLFLPTVWAWIICALLALNLVTVSVATGKRQSV